MKRSIVILSLLGSACAVSLGSELREHVYPRDLQYVTRSEVRTSMLELAHGAAELDRLLASRALPEPQLSGAVATQLHAMRLAAEAIDPGAARSTHPQLEQHMGAFLEELRRAEEAARADPPAYYLAGTVVGACTGCHAASR